MNFKQWLINEEIYPNNTATVYHRTEHASNIERILQSGYKTGGGQMYGNGLYTTISLESQFKSYMSIYGNYVIKFHVTDLDKYLVFHPNMAKKIHGQNYKISDQLKNFNLAGSFTEDKLRQYDEAQEKTGTVNGNNAVKFCRENIGILHTIKGIIYYGTNDGYCLVKYKPVNDNTIKMLGYAEAQVEDINKMNELYANKGWNTSTDKANIKDIQDLEPDQREKYATITPNNLKSVSEIVTLIKDEKSNFEEIFEYIKRNKLIDQKYKNTIVRLILKYKKEISVEQLLELVKYKKEISIEELIELINYKKEISIKQLLELMKYTNMSTSEREKFIATYLPEKVNSIKQYVNDPSNFTSTHDD
jgi:hypothetical protein